MGLLGLINNALDTYYAIKEFNKARGEKHSRLKGTVANVCTPYNICHTAKAIKDVKKHPKEGRNAMYKTAKAYVEMLKNLD